MATFTIRGKNIEITPSLREYVEKRVGKVTKYFEKVGEITVLLTVSKGRHIVEVTVPIQGGIVLRGEEATMDMYTSIDLVVEKLERQIRAPDPQAEDEARASFPRRRLQGRGHRGAGEGPSRRQA
nr:ribosome-associated translation inhibitor RaiA [uncultured Selenomonas sp.]